MLPETPLLQLVAPRALKCLERIRRQIWSPPAPLPVEWAGSSADHVPLAVARKRARRPVTRPFFWGRPEDQAWFRVTIPAAFREGSWHFEWKEQGEATAHVDGIPFAGLDVAHHTCPIPTGCREIWVEVMALEIGMIWQPSTRPSMTSRGCRFEAASARRRDALAWQVFHDLDVLLDLMRDEHERNPSLRTPFGRAVGFSSPLADVSVLYRRLTRAVEEIATAHESGGLAAAARQARAAYRALAGHAEAIRCRLTGHAHIDLVWLWTEKAGEFKAAHTFSTVNRLMDDYPEFRFGYSQPASYRAVGRRSLALLEAVRRRIAGGRWEAVGAAEVESDTQLPCGEALARSLLIGQEGFRDLQGRPSDTLWLPDVFGYSGCLPQIMAQTGVRYFFTTKLVWSAVTQFPYSSFLWRGTDGTEILAHVSHGLGYNQNVTPSEARRGAREYRQSDVHDEFLMPSGFGDGGGGPTPEMCERARRMADLAGTPATAWGGIAEFFAGLESVRHRLPAYHGELYLEYHRGVLTTHGALKSAFREAERALQTWEAAHCLAGRGPVDPAAWRRLVFTQFHDCIPGSSIPAVYKQAVPELVALAGRARRQARAALASQKPVPCVFNPLPIARRQVLGSKLVEIPPLACTPLASLPPIEAPRVEASRSRLANGRVVVDFDAGGRIRAFSSDGVKVQAAGPLAAFALFPDQPHAFEAWDIDRSTLASRIPAGHARFLDCETNGLEARTSFVADLTPRSSALVHYRLDAGSPVLRIDYEIDWREPAHLLKVLFPTRYSGRNARFGAPFGSTLRPQHPGNPGDEARWESAGSRWALVADDGEGDGLYVVTEAKYGWSCRSGLLGLSLLRSALAPSSGMGAVEDDGAPPPTYSDIGPHRIRIAIGRFDPAAPRQDLPATLAESLFTEISSLPSVPHSCGLLAIEGGDSLVPSWAKPEPGRAWTLRLHETLGRRGSARIVTGAPWQIERTDLSGNRWPTQPRRGRLAFSPYELISLRFTRPRQATAAVKFPDTKP